MLVFNYGVSLCIRPVDIDLNTSHVNLQLKRTRNGISVETQFKYISC